MRALVLSVALLVVFAGSARAEIRVIDPLTGAWSTVVADRGSDLVRWTDDGTGLLIRGDGGAIARVGLDGTRTAQPQIDGAVTVSVGPGGRTITVGAEEGRDGEYALRAPDGRIVSVQRGPAFSFTPWVSWSADGARVAAVVPRPHSGARHCNWRGPGQPRPLASDERAGVRGRRQRDRRQ